MDTTIWIKELETWKPLSPIWASNSISRKWQATGFETLRHILDCYNVENMVGSEARLSTLNTTVNVYMRELIM